MTGPARLAAALLQVALAFFPARYRRDYGPEHACVLELALADAAARGRLPLLIFCGRECRDLPAALLREHAKEWRLKMNASPQGTPVTERPLTVRQAALFLSPFVFFVLFPLFTLIRASWWAIVPVGGLLGLVLMTAIFGLAKNLPRWALPSLGLGFAILRYFTLILVYALPGLGLLKTLLWTDFIPGRVPYALVMAFLELLPPVLILVGLALFAARHPTLAGWRRRLGQDWTLLPFILYVTNLLAPSFEDPYRGLEPYELVFALVLIAGAWPCLRAARPRVRLAAMLVATLLAGGVLALGIYQLYPAQEWVQQVYSDFPRWWEAMIPLLNTLALLVALSVLAVFGSRLQREQPVEAPVELTPIQSE